MNINQNTLPQATEEGVYTLHTVINGRPSLSAFTRASHKVVAHVTGWSLDKFVQSLDARLKGSE